MSKTYKIEPEFVISLVIDFYGVAIATTKEQEVLDLYYIPIIGINNKLEEQELKQKILYKVDELLYKYNINTLITTDPLLLSMMEVPVPFAMIQLLIVKLFTYWKRDCFPWLIIVKLFNTDYVGR